MNRTVLRFTILFIVLVLAQVLICNHIVLFGVGVPLIFVYFIIALPTGMSKNLLFTLSFLIGVIVDIFSDTPGVNALACTILAVVKNPVLYAYVDRDDKTRHILPSITTIGWGAYSKYLLSMTAIYCVLAFAIEYFSMIDLREVLVMAGASTALTFFLLMAFDCLYVTRRDRR